MSGHKRRFVTISEGEYRRLHDVDMKSRSASVSSRRQIPSVRSTSEQIMWEQIYQAQQRQNQVDQSLNHVDRSLAELEQQNSRRLLDMQTELIQRIQYSASESSQTTIDQMRGWAGWFDAQMQDLASDLAVYMDEIYQRFDAQAGSEQRTMAVAEYWVEAATSIFSAVIRTYEPGSIFPVETSRLENQIRLAQQDQQEQLYDAAVVIAQQAYQDISALRVRLEQQYQEYSYFRNLAGEQLYQLDLQIGASRLYPAMDLSGELLQKNIDIDYWTSGGLTGLSKEVESLRTQIEQSSVADTEHIKGIVEDRIPTMEDHLWDLIYTARWETLSSQLRINIADLAVKALESQGFDLVEAQYGRQDQRNEFSARVLDYSGSQVKITVEPVPGIALGNELHIISDDVDIRTEHELTRRGREICKTLSQTGLVVSEPLTGSSPAPRMVKETRKQSQEYRLDRNQ